MTDVLDVLAAPLFAMIDFALDAPAAAALAASILGVAAVALLVAIP